MHRHGIKAQCLAELRGKERKRTKCAANQLFVRLICYTLKVHEENGQQVFEAKNGIYFVGSDIELVDVGPVLFVDKNDVPAEDYSKLREMLKGVFLEKYYDYSAK